MKLNDREQRIIELTKELVMRRVSVVPQHPHGFGWGYLWGYVSIRRAQKNGKVKAFDVKVLFGSINVASYSAAAKLAATIPDVSHTYVNPD